MILQEHQMEQMLELSKPLIKWLNENCHPHCEIKIQSDSVEILEGFARVPVKEFIKD